VLAKLVVKNFAIIDRIELSFAPGMTVLTGETGAGKSLLIDAVSLIAGDRANQEMIRSGCDRAEIEAVFTDAGDRLAAVLDRLGIDHPEGVVRIRRELSLKGSNVIRVNDVSVTLQQLKEIAAKTIDVHTQFDSQRLFDPGNYVDLVDRFKPDATFPYRTAYAAALAAYADADAAWKNLVREKDELEERLDLYRHQLAELDAFGLDVKEEDALREERAMLANFDRIDAALREAKRLFAETGILENLYDAGSELERLAPFSADFTRQKERVRDAYYELDDVRSDIDRRLRELDFDAGRYAEVEARLAAIGDLVRKYRRPVAQLIELRTTLAAAVDRSDHYDTYLEQASSARVAAYASLLRTARELTAVRKTIAHRIETELAGVFADLCLPGTRFRIAFAGELPETPAASDLFLDNGVDRLDFLISTNVGEPLKPLAKTASGGETSRVMLAFKTIFAKSQELAAIVFDEIDTGISGIVAKQIARKIKAVSASCQVIAISHVPQVVAAADRQIHVVKRENGGRTVADASELGFEDRIRAIAEMLSGTKDSPAGIASAKELLLNA